MNDIGAMYVTALGGGDLLSFYGLSLLVAVAIARLLLTIRHYLP